MNYDTKLFAEHLRGMVRIPTVSAADPEKTDVPGFLKLHDYLEKTYPLIHEKMAREIVGRAGLLYHLKGTGKSGRLPLMLIAHQDVVPEGDHALWKHAPFSGDIDEDGMLWGRGCTDSKCNIQAYMDALEMLLAEGFTPDYDLYFGFGYNEEVMGGPEPAAKLICNVLKERGIELGCLIDECGGITFQDGKPVYATIYTSEKGYADFEFAKRHPGGHSAAPPVHTALGTLGRAACIIEDNRMPVRLTEPVVTMLERSREFITDPEIKALCGDVRGNWEKLWPLLEENKQYSPLIRTTIALTMAKGSDQANILPEKAVMIANTRALPGETMDDLMEHFKAILPDDIDVTVIKGTNPPPVQSTEPFAYGLIADIVNDMYPGIPMIPSMLFGGTDSRYYCDICPTGSVYRFTGLGYDPRWENTAHKANERIPLDILAKNVEFYVRLIKGYGE